MIVYLNYILSELYKKSLVQISSCNSSNSCSLGFIHVISIGWVSIWIEIIVSIHLLFFYSFFLKKIIYSIKKVFLNCIWCNFSTFQTAPKITKKTKKSHFVIKFFFQLKKWRIFMTFFRFCHEKKIFFVQNTLNTSERVIYWKIGEFFHWL